MKFFNYLNEKQIIIGGGKKYGQVVFLAGGAGSGKGFAISNFMEMDKFKIRDVDALKVALVKLAKSKGETEGIASTDFKNPDDVFRLHALVKSKGIIDHTLDLLLTGAEKQTLPNILFDVTLKDIGDVRGKIRQLFEIGYKPEDIHIVWVLTNYDIAVEQNLSRDRIVPAHIVLDTHQGAAKTMMGLLKNEIQGIGTLIDGSITVVLNNKENTIYMTTSDTRKTIKGKDKFIQLSGEKIEKNGSFIIKSFKSINVKEVGKPLKTDDDFEHELYKWKDLEKWVEENSPK